MKNSSVCWSCQKEDLRLEVNFDTGFEKAHYRGKVVHTKVLDDYEHSPFHKDSMNLFLASRKKEVETLQIIFDRQSGAFFHCSWNYHWVGHCQHQAIATACVGKVFQVIKLIFAIWVIAE